MIVKKMSFSFAAPKVNSSKYFRAKELKQSRGGLLKDLIQKGIIQSIILRLYKGIMFGVSGNLAEQLIVLHLFLDDLSSFGS